MKWCCKWSDVLSDVMCWVKWHSSFIYISSYFLVILLSLPSFLTLTSLYLLNCTNSVLLLHLITLRLTTFCRIPTDKWSAQRNDLYLTTHNTQNTQNKRHTSTPRAGFKPPVPTIKLPQTHTSDRSAAGIGVSTYRVFNWVAACLVLCNTNWLIGYFV